MFRSATYHGGGGVGEVFKLKWIYILYSRRMFPGWWRDHPGSEGEGEGGRHKRPVAFSMAIVRNVLRNLCFQTWLYVKKKRENICYSHFG